MGSEMCIRDRFPHQLVIPIVKPADAAGQADDAWRAAVRLNVVAERCSMVWLARNVMLECSETACAAVQLGVSAARLRDAKP